ncbi:MAG: NADH-quinone oxidoreductase subunit C [Actinomycetota bacterium]
MIQVELTPDEWVGRAEELRAEGWWLADLAGLDRLRLGFDDRFGIVATFLHRERKERQTIHVAAPGEPPTVPSITHLWAGVAFFEREAFDMFGIHFEGHPNLTRILMPDQWEGHPLRKDYGVGKVPVDFLHQPLLQIDAPGQSPRATEAETSLDGLGQTEGGLNREERHK